jgi:hypothetical protein
MRSSRLLLACILLPTVSATSAGAQQLPPFAGGDTVRVHAPRVALKHARVTFVAWGDSTLRVGPGRGDATVAVPFGEVMRLDRYAGKNRFKGAVTGAGIFGTLGLVAGLLIGKGAVSGCQEFLCELDALEYAAAGMLAGVAIGIPVGATALAPDRWRRVELPVALGFPAYRQPFHETVVFRVLFLAGGTLLSLAIN